MAYLSPWRERWRTARAGMASAGRHWRLCRRRAGTLLETAWAQIPSPCLLCRERARGGCLCEACRRDAMASRVAAPCCERCGLNAGSDAGTGIPAGVPFESCPDCSALSPAFDKVIAAFDYAFPGDVLLRQFKQQHRFQHGRALSELMAQTLAPALPDWWPQAWLVPIPSSAQALRRRGFNPAAELARRLEARLGASVRTDILSRRREADAARVQKRLPRRQRLQTPALAFECRVPLAGARIVLVDDVMSTGATLHGAAQVLRQAGAQSVWGVVAARTPYQAR